MVFVACGLNHKTAPIEVREKIALPVSMHDTLLNRLVESPQVFEAAILSTCNRTEIYCETNDPSTIIPWIAREHELSPEELSPYFYLHPDHHGVRHTLRVASGLDSMMLGEPQILGQMKQAYLEACRLGTVKNNLRNIFQYVFNATKRIRNHSGIGNNPVSIAYAAVQLIGKLYSDYRSLNVFIIGRGETAALVMKYLEKEGVHRFMIAGRTHDHTKNLADKYAATTLTISDIPQYLHLADIVITATSCPLPFINKNMVSHALVMRKNTPMFLLDLSVPRDIEADVSELEAVHLYNIDDLQTVIQKGIDERRTAALKAEQLIESALDQYIRRHRLHKAKSIICDYRKQMQSMAQLELQRAMQKLSTGTAQHLVLEEFSTRLVNKLIHAPTLCLRKAASENHEEFLDLAQYLLDQSNYEKIT